MNVTTNTPTRAEYYCRHDGLVSPQFRNTRILAVGCGAGSYMIEKLARIGPAEIRLVDNDRVDPANLSRTAYDVADIDELKVTALQRHIQDASPFVKVVPFPDDICRIDAKTQVALLDDVDLIIAGTDHFPAQALLNQWSQARRIPAVFIGVHAGAQGGRIIWSLPDVTPCYRCVATDRYWEFEQGGMPATDLPGARGLLCDVQFIDMVALKVVLALLEREETTPLGRFFTAMGGRNEIIIRTTPDYAYGTLLWDAVLSDLPVYHPYAQELKDQVLCAMDTLWLTTSFVPDCPDCGGRVPEA